MLLKVILIALTMCLGSLSQQTTETSYYDYRMTELISTTDHQPCTVHTSTKLTLIQCDSSYEAYLTKDLVIDPHGLTNGGSTRVISTVKQSMVPGKEDRLTFLENRSVKEIYYDEDIDSIETTTLLTLPISTKVTIQDVTVFYEYVSVYYSKKFYFYELPLVAGDSGNKIEIDDDLVFPTTEMLSFDYSQNLTSGAQELFILTPGNFTKFDIQYNQTNHQLIINGTNATAVDFEGDEVTFKASQDYLIVVCGDCKNGTSNFEIMSKNFTTLFERSMLTAWPFDITYLQQPEIGRFAGFIASKSQIDLIQAQTDWDENPYFSYTPQVYSDTSLIDINKHAISISGSKEFVIFKKKSYPGIFFIPICTPYQQYSEVTATCDACSFDQRTLGMQDESCVACPTFFLDYDTDFKEALYEQVCSEGTVKAFSLSVAPPIMVGMLVLVCCCANNAMDKKAAELKNNQMKMNKDEDEMSKLNIEVKETKRESKDQQSKPYLTSEELSAMENKKFDLPVKNTDGDTLMNDTKLNTQNPLADPNASNKFNGAPIQVSALNQDQQQTNRFDTQNKDDDDGDSADIDISLAKSAKKNNAHSSIKNDNV